MDQDRRPLTKEQTDTLLRYFPDGLFFMRVMLLNCILPETLLKSSSNAIGNVRIIRKDESSVLMYSSDLKQLMQCIKFYFKEEYGVEGEYWQFPLNHFGGWHIKDDEIHVSYRQVKPKGEFDHDPLYDYVLEHYDLMLDFPLRSRISDNSYEKVEEFQEGKKGIQMLAKKQKTKADQKSLEEEDFNNLPKLPSHE